MERQIKRYCENTTICGKTNIKLSHLVKTPFLLPATLFGSCFVIKSAKFQTISPMNQPSARRSSNARKYSCMKPSWNSSEKLTEGRVWRPARVSAPYSVTRTGLPCASLQLRRLLNICLWISSRWPWSEYLDIFGRMSVYCELKLPSKVFVERDDIEMGGCKVEQVVRVQCSGDGSRGVKCASVPSHLKKFSLKKQHIFFKTKK